MLTRRSLSVCIDCRWLGLGGAGRATELLLRGLAQLRPESRWTLWGRAENVEPWRWPEARLTPSGEDPRSKFGQKRWWAVPPSDVHVYMHHTRPLRPGRSVTVIHDTISVRYGASAGRRRLKRLFYKSAAAVSSRIITDSSFSRSCIERDLAVKRSKISVVPLPVDDELARRVRTLRRRSGRSNVALYAGRFPPYKNLGRLIEAFRVSAFHASGGELLLVGGFPSEVSSLAHLAGGPVRIEGVVSQEKLEELYATSRLLVLPSLEEGFGLPLWEAMACGLPVCASRAGALPEIAAPEVRLFDPTSVADIAGSIDAVASGALEIDYPLARRSPADYAQHFIVEIERAANIRRA